MSHLTKIVALQSALHDKGLTCPRFHKAVVEEAIARATLAYLHLTNTVHGESLNIDDRRDVIRVLDKWNEISPFNVKAVVDRSNTLNTLQRNLLVNGWCESRHLHELDVDTINGVSKEEYNPCKCLSFNILFSALRAEMIKYGNQGEE